jgi:glycosyltransferase involved in cell wall biosynthesis
MLAGHSSLRRVMMINTSYRTGGAEHSGADLLEALRRRGIECRMFVGWGVNPTQGRLPIPSRSPLIAAALSRIATFFESSNSQLSRGHFVRPPAEQSRRRSLIESALSHMPEIVTSPCRVSGWYLLRLAQITSSLPSVSSGLERMGKAVASMSATRCVRYLLYRFERPLIDPRSADYLGPVGSWRLLSDHEPLPDILHAHNLHGPVRGYFDLRALPSLSARVPLVLSLRDAWTMSGHCAHSFGCERWLTGCGECPDLTIYPQIPSDRTAKNWLAKRDIYRASRLYVHAISNWIKERAERSMLADGIRDLRVIHTGIDRSIFKPGDQSAARRRLGLPADRRLLVFAATRPKDNSFKDLACLRACLSRIGADSDLGATTLVAVGEESRPERFGSAELVYWPYVTDRTRLADLYRAADIYLHAAKVDTFPRAILESLACGTPVIATAVGGIPEQIRSLRVAFGAHAACYQEDLATGVLVSAGDSAAMAEAVRLVSTNEVLRRRLGENAAVDAADRFDLETQTEKMIAWYKEVITDFRGLPPTRSR